MARLEPGDKVKYSNKGHVAYGVVVKTYGRDEVHIKPEKEIVKGKTIEPCLAIYTPSRYVEKQASEI